MSDFNIENNMYSLPDAHDPAAEAEQQPGSPEFLLPVLVDTTANREASFALPEEQIVSSLAGGNSFLIRNTPDDSGVYAVLETKNEPLTIFLCSLLLVIALFRDVKNKGWGRKLIFQDIDGNEHIYILNAANVTKDESVLISGLRNEGLTITTQKMYHHRLIDYLLNTRPLTDHKIRSTSMTGWHSNNLFVTQLAAFGESDEEVIYDGKITHHSFAVRGTHKQWLDNVARLCVGNHVLVLGVSMSFAAPLLKPLNMENGGFNLMGDSSIGKSTVLKAATSTFGRPEKGHAVQQWNATANAMEAIAAAYNDGMLPLDEIGQATGHEVGNTIYLLGNGMGKGRMTSSAELRIRQTFRTLFLSNGERTLEAHMGESGKTVRAGQGVRLVDLVADMGKGYGIYNCIHDQKSSYDFNELLLDNVQQYYGTPMVAYLEKLVQLPDSAYDRMKMLMSRFTEECIPVEAGGEVKRIADRFALVACGGELATILGITGWKPGVAYDSAKYLFNRWLVERGDTGKSEDHKLLAQVRRFFEMHGESRFASYDPSEDTRTVINRVGFRNLVQIPCKNPETGVTELKAQYVYYVMSEGFKEICAGFSHKRASRTLLTHGILMPNIDGSAMHSKRLPGFMHPKKVYIFGHRVIEDFGTPEPDAQAKGTEDTQAQTA